VEQGRRLARSNLCLLALANRKDRTLQIQSAAGMSSPWPEADLEMSSSLLGQAHLEGRPLVFPDLVKEAPFQLQEWVLKEGLMSMLVVPVMYRDRGQGVLATLYDRVHRPEAREIRLLQLLAGQFAVALENARRYEQIVAMEENLRRTERFSLLGSLAAEIAHDIRNPITIINMLLHSVSEQVNNSTMERDLGVVMGKLDQINRIVEQTLQLARSSEMNLEAVGVNEVLNDLLLFLRYKMDQCGVRLQLRLDPGEPVAVADRSQIQQVFLNLLVNAIQAMGEGGTLTVRTGVRDDEASDGWVVVSVTDTGTGIEDSAQARLFDPFFTTRPEGTGLGLFISQKIAANHGGKITVRSAPGKGSTFSVHFPRRSSEA